MDSRYICRYVRLANEQVVSILPPLTTLQTFWVSIQIYNFAVAIVKMAFLAQYYRIMTLKKMRQWVLIVTGIVGAWSM